MSGVLLAVAAALVGAGCQSQLTRVRADNARLNQELATLRAEQRRAARDRQREAGRVALADRAQPTPRPTELRGDATAALPVQVLGPMDVSAPTSDTLGSSFTPRTYADGTRVVGMTEDGTEIVYADDATGAAGSSHADDGLDADAGPDDLSLIGDLDPDDLGVPLEDAPARPAPPPRAAPPKPAKRASAATIAATYQAAVAMLRADEHAAAIAALRAFVAAYPASDYADNAQYWLGEAFYDQRDYDQALAEFRATIENYPEGNKVPDALLKIAFTNLAQGQVEPARATLTDLVRDFPTTEPGKLAAARLETIAP